MTPYWLLYAMWTAGTVQFSPERAGKNSRTLFAVAAVVTALLIGLRYQVGGDWNAYLGIYNSIFFQPLPTSLTLTDPGYALLNWIFAQANIGVWAVNLVCAVLFMAGVGRLASRQPNPWLAVLVAVPYLIIVVAMGYTRQAAAIGIVCFGIADASERHVVRLVAFVAVAALFHKTAILILPVLLLPIVTRNFLLGAIGAFVFALLFGFVLQGATDQMIASYAQSNYDSQGAGIRIAMNVVAACVMLIFRDRLGFDSFARSFWTYNAILALLSVVALFSLSASSGVDRLSLFLIPLQIVTLARLPYLTARPSVVILLGVLFYTFAVQFVWLNYATNADSWLPYSAVFAPAD